MISSKNIRIETEEKNVPLLRDKVCYMKPIL